jgi:hypothetical protein
VRDVEVKRIAGYETSGARACHLEVWFAAGALGAVR